MNINTNKFALAAALSFAVIWIFCSLVVALMPHLSMNVTGAMMHSNMAWQWDMNWIGLVIGLIGWSFGAGVTAWLMATFYNWLVKGDRHE